MVVGADGLYDKTDSSYYLKPTGISIDGNVSLTGLNRDITINGVSVLSDYTVTNGTIDGTHGLVPAPITTDVGYFLSADNGWHEVTVNTDLMINNDTWDGVNEHSLKTTLSSILSRLDTIENTLNS